MLGTIVNTAAVVAGGIIGVFIKSRLNEKYKVIIMQGIGISVIFVGIKTSVEQMILPGANPVLFIISLVIGGIIGQAIGIDDGMNKFGAYMQEKVSKNDDSFSKSFIYGSILFCVGTMSILGSIQSGTLGNHELLYIKSVLDGITSIIIASSSGIGVIFAAGSVLIWQGTLTLLSGFFGPYFTNDMNRELSILGGILVAAIGLDLLDIKKMKVANFLPAILIPVVYYIITGFK